MRLLMMGVILTSCVSIAGAEDGNPQEPRFRGSAREIGSLGISSNFSDDGLAATLLFDNLVIDMNGMRDILVRTKAVSLTIPIINEASDTHFIQDIRGFVDVDEGARAVFVVQAAGKTHVVDLLEAKDDEGIVRTRNVPMAEERAAELAKERSEADELPEGFDFSYRMESKVPAGASNQITFFLLLERDAQKADVGGLLAIDSLDLLISKPSDGKGVSLGRPITRCVNIRQPIRVYARTGH